MALLWQWHSLHHSDVIPDVGPMWRHHPAEIVLSGLVMGGVAILLGGTVAETDSNYGEVFSLWDRVFRTLNRSGPPARFGLDKKVAG